MIRERSPKHWQVRISDGTGPDGKRRFAYRTVRGTRTEARRAEAALARDVARSRHTSPMTVAAMCEEWLSVAPLEQSTLYQHRRTIARYVIPTLGDRQARTVTPLELDRLYILLAHTGGKAGGPLSPSTVAGVHRIIHAAYAQAVRWGTLDENPASRARGPRQTRRDPHAPHVETIRAFLAQCVTADPALAVFVRVAAASGLRRGAICALQWGDLNVASSTLQTVRAVKTAGPAGAYVGDTKTGARHIIGIDETTMAVLAAHRERVAPTSEADYIFGAADPPHPGSLTRRFGRVRRAAGVTITLRELRHFVATALLDAGIPAGTVAGRLSHARPSTTTDIYGAWVVSTDRTAARILETVLSGESITSSE